jgi:hypothetical protein
MAWAIPQLRCQIDQAGESKTIVSNAVSDPYRAKAIDINGRFRFKAVMVGNDAHIEYIKLYTYYQTARQDVLLHQASYSAIDYVPAATLPLTGVVRLYSPPLGRELQYACVLGDSAA